MKHIYMFSAMIFLGWLIMSCGIDSKPTYSLNTTATPVEVGSVTPASGMFTEGASVQLTASPNQHWVFNRWEGDLAGTQNPATVTMNSVIISAFQTYCPKKMHLARLEVLKVYKMGFMLCWEFLFEKFDLSTKIMKSVRDLNQKL